MHSYGPDSSFLRGALWFPDRFRQILAPNADGKFGAHVKVAHTGATKAFRNGEPANRFIPVASFDAAKAAYATLKAQFPCDGDEEEEGGDGDDDIVDLSGDEANAADADNRDTFDEDDGMLGVDG